MTFFHAKDEREAVTACWASVFGASDAVAHAGPRHESLGEPLGFRPACGPVAGVSTLVQLLDRCDDASDLRESVDRSAWEPPHFAYHGGHAPALCWLNLVSRGLRGLRLGELRVLVDDASCVMQRWWRRAYVRLCERKSDAALRLQTAFRGFSGKLSWGRAFAACTGASLHLQRVWRGHRCERAYAVQRGSAVAIQSMMRCRWARVVRADLQLRADYLGADVTLVFVQGLIRRQLARWAFVRHRGAAMKLQAMFKGPRDRAHLGRVLECTRSIQGAMRGGLQRWRSFKHGQAVIAANTASTTIAARLRGHWCASTFGKQRRGVVRIQAMARRFLDQRIAVRQLGQRLHREKQRRSVEVLRLNAADDAVRRDFAAVATSVACTLEGRARVAAAAGRAKHRAREVRLARKRWRRSRRSARSESGAFGPSRRLAQMRVSDVSSGDTARQLRANACEAHLWCAFQDVDTRGRLGLDIREFARLLVNELCLPFENADIVQLWGMLARHRVRVDADAQGSGGGSGGDGGSGSSEANEPCILFRPLLSWYLRVTEGPVADIITLTRCAFSQRFDGRAGGTGGTGGERGDTTAVAAAAAATATATATSLKILSNKSVGIPSRRNRKWLLVRKTSRYWFGGQMKMTTKLGATPDAPRTASSSDASMGLAHGWRWPWKSRYTARGCMDVLVEERMRARAQALAEFRAGEPPPMACSHCFEPFVFADEWNEHQNTCAATVRRDCCGRVSRFAAVPAVTAVT